MNNLNLTAFKTKSVVITAIRAFLDQQGFQEVITPVLSRGIPVEPNLHPFTTDWTATDQSQTLYLATSPENALKKLLSLGLGNCYALGKTFRNLEGTGSRHRPEFLMLEWYRWQADYRQIMADTANLVRFVKQAVDTSTGVSPTDDLTYQGQTWSLAGEWPVISLDELCQQTWQVGLAELTKGRALEELAIDREYQIDGASWSQLFDQLFLNELEQLLPEGPCFMIDFPARISPLCQPRRDKPYLAERFEVFFNRIELGNGNTELIQADQLWQSFESEQQARQQRGENVPELDQDFLKALANLQTTGHSLAGIGLGVERLAMIMADVTDIGSVDPLVVTNHY